LRVSKAEYKTPERTLLFLMSGGGRTLLLDAIVLPVIVAVLLALGFRNLGCRISVEARSKTLPYLASFVTSFQVLNELRHV
jgi:hypothetical protein